MPNFPGYNFFSFFHFFIGFPNCIIAIVLVSNSEHSLIDSHTHIERERKRGIVKRAYTRLDFVSPIKKDFHHQMTVTRETRKEFFR